MFRFDWHLWNTSVMLNHRHLFQVLFLLLLFLLMFAKMLAYLHIGEWYLVWIGMITFCNNLRIQLQSILWYWSWYTIKCVLSTRKHCSSNDKQDVMCQWWWAVIMNTLLGYVIVISEDFPVYKALHQIGQRSCPIRCNVSYKGKSSDLSDLSLIPHLWNWPTNYNIVTSLRQESTGCWWNKIKG